MQRKAFSLVEVAIALGLVTFVVIALLGLLSSMMERNKEARDYLVWSNIIMGIADEFTMHPWSDLPQGQTSYLFDSHGFPVEGAESGALDVTVELITPSDPTLAAPEVADSFRRYEIAIKREAASDVLASSTFTVAKHAE